VPAFSIRAVVRASLAAWRRDFRFLTLLVLILQTPIVLAELVVSRITHTLPGTDRGFTLSISAGFLAFTSTLVHHFLAGLIERIEGSHRHGRPHPTLNELARTLPWHRLIIADVVITLAIGLGLALFVVPGILVGSLTILTLPLLNMEGQPVWPTVRRSAHLARHSLARVIVLWFVTAVLLHGAQEALGELGERLADSVTGEFVAHILAEVIFAPILALPVVMMTFDLVDLDEHFQRARADAVTGETKSVVTPELG
jgi:Na+/melibiose symporter-like transporter